MGTHIPEFGYLNVLLGVEPVLAPEQRFYQRCSLSITRKPPSWVENHLTAHGIAPPSTTSSCRR